MIVTAASGRRSRPGSAERSVGASGFVSVDERTVVGRDALLGRKGPRLGDDIFEIHGSRVDGPKSAQVDVAAGRRSGQRRAGSKARDAWDAWGRGLIRCWLSGAGRRWVCAGSCGRRLGRGRRRWPLGSWSAWLVSGFGASPQGSGVSPRAARMLWISGCAGSAMATKSMQI